MLKYTIQLLLFLFIFSITSCKTKKMEHKEVPIVMNKKEVSEKIFSPDKTKVLQLTYIQGMNPTKTFNYKVFNSRTRKELKSGIFKGVKLGWNDNKSLKGFLYQGIVQSEENADDTQDYKIINLNK